VPVNSLWISRQQDPGVVFPLGNSFQDFSIIPEKRLMKTLFVENSIRPGSLSLS